MRLEYAKKSLKPLTKGAESCITIWFTIHEHFFFNSFQINRITHCMNAPKNMLNLKKKIIHHHLSGTPKGGKDLNSVLAPYWILFCSTLAGSPTFPFLSVFLSGLSSFVLSPTSAGRVKQYFCQNWLSGKILAAA